ncbi:MAG: hypothetical protein QM741_11335 [Rudaea sp.]|uniref:DUF6932 family protein n=1 Tax=Rudaea sp. TaxID=2136325 RepID=UPI0039E34FDD
MTTGYSMDWKQITGNFFDEASEKGFPVFLGDGGHSTPLNASPYIVEFDRFVDVAKRWSGRGRLVDELRRCRNAAEDIGICIELILIGGSFTDLRNASPHDLDSLWLYRARGTDPVCAEKLKTLQNDSRRNGIDCRFVPFDGEPALLVKAVSFFTVLYSINKRQMTLDRGLILLDSLPLQPSGQCSLWPRQSQRA